MRPRIAIPVPHGGDPEYAARALPQYERAVEMAGGEPVAIPLDKTPEEIMRIIERCDGVLLPGSKADVDPAKYDAPRHPDSAPADPKRDTVDELLLQDAYNMRKPILGVCYGLQVLNVYRSGSLLQHIESPVNHAAGRKLAVVHAVEVDPKSRLAAVVAAPDPIRKGPDPHPSRGDSNPGGHGFSRAPELAQNVGALAPALIPVNSSHHQSADVIGDGLRAVARCPEDGIIEAVEGTSPDHFVLAVQWHPERSVDDDAPSRAIFRALVEAARTRNEKLVGEFEGL